MNESTVEVPAEFDIDYVFTCDSDEMVEARIYPGDLLGVKACETVEHGQTAVIEIGDKFLVRRVYRGPNYICFAPTNHNYESIVVVDGEESHVKIIGRVVKAWFDVN